MFVFGYEEDYSFTKVLFGPLVERLWSENGLSSRVFVELMPRASLFNITPIPSHALFHAL